MSDGYSTEDGYFDIGGTASPVTSSLTNSLLFDADPSLYYMCSFLNGVIQLQIGPRWNAEVVRAGLSELDGYSVNEVLPYDPFRNGLSKQNSWRFPLLAIYPRSSSYDFKTVTWYEIARDFELIFCLPPLNSEQYEYLHPFLQYVEKVILDRTLQGVDTNFNNGEQPWKLSGLEKISLVKSSYGNIPYQTNLSFPTISMQLQVWERRMPSPDNYEDFTGVDNEIVLSGFDGYDNFSF